MLPGTSNSRGQPHRLAGLADLFGDQLVGVLGHQRRPAWPAPRTGRPGSRVAQPAQRRAGRRDRGVDVGRGGQRELGDDVAGRRVDHLMTGAAGDHRRTVDPAACHTGRYRRSHGPTLADGAAGRLRIPAVAASLERVISSVWLLVTTDSVHNRQHGQPGCCSRHPARLAARATAVPGRRVPARRAVQGDHREAAAGRPPLVCGHRQGGRAVRGRGAAARPAHGRRRRHADRRRHRSDAARLRPPGDDRHPLHRATPPRSPRSSPRSTPSTTWCSPRAPSTPSSKWSARTTTTCSTCSTPRSAQCQE